MSERSRGI